MAAATFSSATRITARVVSETNDSSPDHQQPALNRYGDLAVAYHRLIPGGVASQRVVTVRIWNFDEQAGNIVLEPSIELEAGVPGGLFATNESVEHPWIVALADGSFVVTFQRRSLDADTARGEAILLVASGSGASKTWTAKRGATPNPIAGFVMGSAYTPGDSGSGFSRSCWAGNQGFLVVTPHQKSKSGTTPVARLYDIRGGLLNWSNPDGDPTVVAQAAALPGLGDVKLEDTASRALVAGGLGLSSAVIDRYGNLVLATEEFDYVDGTYANDIGRLRISRVQGIGGPDPLAALEAAYNQRFLGNSGGTKGRQIRRPMLASNAFQNFKGSNSVLLVYGDGGLIASGASVDSHTDYSRAARIIFDKSGDTTPEVTDVTASWASNLGADNRSQRRTSASGVVTPWGLEVVAAISDFDMPLTGGNPDPDSDTGRTIEFFYPADNSVEHYLPIQGGFPDRVKMVGTMTDSGRKLVALGYETANEQGGSPTSQVELFDFA